MTQYPEYEASSIGRVRKIESGRIISQRESSQTHYLRVTIDSHDKRYTPNVHAMVAFAFMGPANSRVINHIDFNRQNNSLANLEYVSQAENIRHSARAGRMASGLAHGRHTMPDRTSKGASHRWAKIGEKEVLEIREKHKTGTPLRQLSEEYGVAKSTIHAIANRVNWKHLP